MVDIKLAMVSLVLFGLVSTETKYRQKRQAWRKVPTFHLSDGKPVNQSPPAKKPAHDPPPPPPPNPKGGATDPWGTGGLNWNFGMGSSGMNTGMGSGGTGGNTAGASTNRWDHPPQNMWQPPPPPPPPPSNHQTQRNNHPPPPPPNHWNHMPPPPPNHWHHPPPPPQNHWAPPPPPPPQPKAASGGSSMAGALASLQQQMQMSMLTAGIDTPDARKFNPAPIEILQYTCPIELPVKQCLINPCPTRCKRYPLAKCYTNPCGNCSPEWIQNNMKIIDCD